MHVLLKNIIEDTSCPGEAEWFNRMAATKEGAARKNKKRQQSATSFIFIVLF